MSHNTDLKSSAITFPSGPVEREITYHVPFTPCNRKNNYATVWEKLEERSSKV